MGVPTKIQRRTRSVLMWVAIVPVLLAALAFWTRSAYVTRVEWVLHTQQLLTAIDELVLSVTGMETGQRGYLLTGKEEYLQPLNRARELLGQRLAALRALTADSPNQRRELEGLVPLVREKEAEVQQTIALYKRGHPMDALNVVRTDRGQELMQEIRTIANRMRADERQRLRTRIADQQEMDREVISTYIAGLVVMLGLLFWAGRLIETYALRRDQAESEIRHLNATLEQHVQEIDSLNRGLEQRVAERTVELEKANFSLRRSNADLQRFAYIASHDLQEPLRMVASYMGLISRRYQGRLDADADTFIGYAVDGAKRMQALILDLLAYSRAGSQQMNLAPTQLEEVLNDALGLLRSTVADSGAEITHDPLPELMVDPLKLAQVFQNLIANAIKFRQPERAPKIHISAQRDGAAWHFTVADNGIGFAEKDAERIFQLFQRLHEMGKYPGTGIGLAITQRIIESHGGRIWAESEPGAGSKFHFTLPASA